MSGEEADNSAPTEAPTEAPAEEPADNAQSQPQDMPGTLHAAVESGSVEAVKYLLSKKADTQQPDGNGKTPLELAEAGLAGDKASDMEVIISIIKEASPPAEKGMDDTYGEGFENETPAPSPTAAEQSAPSGSPSPTADSEPEPAQDLAATAPAASRGDEIPEEMPSKAQVEAEERAEQRKANSLPSSPAGHLDLKKKTEFGGTVNGVLKRTTFMSSISGFRSGPKYTLLGRGPGTFIRSSSTPAPGTYNMPADEKGKFKAPPKYSFGSGSRFGLGQSPLKKQPGPGAYNPYDPTLHTDTKVGFGTSVRGKGVTSTANPGPGAYEEKQTIGGGLMFTARGRHATSYLRSRSMPGPGAYNPQDHFASYQPPKCGFGTSTRDDMAARNARSGMMPGPGTYELQNFNTIGKDSKKFSATSRRKLHDLNSYVTPGPGTYNSHMTCFGN